MLRTVLVILLLGLGVLTVVDRTRRAQIHPAGLSTPPAPVDAPTAGARCCAATRPGPAPEPTAVGPPTATPELDLLARLAVRRRIAREGSRVYLDSLFPHTDSVVTRWSERTSLTVALVPDTLLARWTPALLDDARAGMRAWNATGLGPTLRESTAGDSADITVHWTDILPDSGLVGSTTVNWGPDGIIHHAAVILALRRNTDSVPLASQVRRRVASHELGHALGLPHSNHADDIMFPTSPVAEPSSRDQATLRLLYVLFPGPLRVQP